MVTEYPAEVAGSLTRLGRAVNWLDRAGASNGVVAPLGAGSTVRTESIGDVEVGPIELRSNDGWEVGTSEAKLSDGAAVGVGNREGCDEL